MRIYYKEAERGFQYRKVAAYCRVSTARCDQEESYETQVNYYRKYIQGHENWEYAGVYADYGSSGTDVRHRPEFQRMIADALEGKIDDILVKSISRFSRNVVECGRYAELLAGNHVYLHFEKENIKTEDPASFLIFGLMSNVAQSESESVSQNMRWMIRKRFESGDYYFGMGRILGFDKAEGSPVPNQDDWMIRMIFQKYLEGWPYCRIAEYIRTNVNTEGRGKALSESGIAYILRNEAYVGDKMLQKCSPKNFLTHQPDHSIPAERFYVTDGHPPLIDRATWNKTQDIIRKREKLYTAGIHVQPGRSHFLYGKVFCGKCGSPYLRRTIGQGDRSHKVWCCRDRFHGKRGNGCKNRNIREEVLLNEIAGQFETGKQNRDFRNGEAFQSETDNVIIYENRIQFIADTLTK